MTNNEAYWTERALKRAEEAYLHDAALTAKLFQEYESAAKAIKREISAFYSKYAGKYGLTYDQAVRLLNRKEFQEWKASLAEYVDYIATIQDPKVKALLTAQLDALSANSSISRLEALQGQIDLILNDLFDKGVAQMKNQFGDDFVEGYYKKCYDLQSRAGFFNEIAKIDCALALEVPNEVIEKRMTGRRVCLRCGATYHVEANPPRVADVCDICGDKLVIRSDDQADVVRHRLETYHEQTEPLKGYYDAQGKLKSIDGTKGIHETEKFAVEALGL